MFVDQWVGTVGVNSVPASLVSQRQSRSFRPVVFTEEKNSVLTACIGWCTHTVHVYKSTKIFNLQG